MPAREPDISGQGFPALWTGAAKKKMKPNNGTNIFSSLGAQRAIAEALWSIVGSDITISDGSRLQVAGGTSDGRAAVTAGIIWICRKSAGTWAVTTKDKVRHRWQFSRYWLCWNLFQGLAFINRAGF